MTGTALQIVEPGEVPALHTGVRAVGLLRPLAAPADVLTAQNEVRALVSQALQPGRDYGVIPGTDKPTLFKPGAERLTLAFGLAPRFRIVDQDVDHDREVKYLKRRKVYRNEHRGDKRYDWKEETGLSLGLYRYVVECELVHRETGTVIAACIGSCSSMESRYVDRPRDVENTLLKMAEKRAYIGATLLALGLSDQFTQDTDDLAANGVLDARQDTSTPDPVAAEAHVAKANAATANAAASGAAAPVAPANNTAVYCPKCGGPMWDNRTTKRNPKAPDYKCQDRGCDGVVWPPKGKPTTTGNAMDAQDTPMPPARPIEAYDDELPL